MRILVLDDEPVRHELFRAAWGDILSVWSADAAIVMLTLERFGIVSLDHDLGPGGTGLDVVDHIVSMPADRRPLNVLVHSANPVGAAAMLGTLQRAGIDAQQIDPLRLVTRR